MNIIQKLSTYSHERFDTLLLIGTLLALVINAMGFEFFNQYTALLYGLFSGLILVLFFKNWLIDNFFTLWPMGFFTFCIVFEFAFMLYDQVHLKDDWYFLPWAVLLGGVFVVAISILIVLKKITLQKTLSKALYISVIFLFSTVYSYGLLSLINIFNARQVVKWERVKVGLPSWVITLGGNYNDAIFENKEWGTRWMNLFFLKWEGDFPHPPTTAEVKVFKGNFGKDYMLKTYDEDEKNDARQID
ncbi:MAG: hypothetical protein LBV59_02810 [Sphingobacterium sp.]|jgi:hypothetical protein|uniref:hypothetical protein n=1 Tax=Sphingobacterium sp. TaxID=341027 RepID=UPI00284D44E2|nr:hypothetical protein [Sphingobacterium sp.]MDR3006835.1 hypothetical protein [Sphingobacterium sp.]